MESDELWLHGVIAEELQDLLLESVDVADFLQELSRYASDIFSGPEHPVLCSVTVVRLKKPSLVAASGPEAFAMNQVQIDADEGPCLAAIREHRTVYARDLGRHGRWGALSAQAVTKGFLSVMCIPLDMKDQMQGALSFYAEVPSAFGAGEIVQAEIFARQASKAVLLALRIGDLHDSRDDLIAAMASRTVIDIAIGAIVAQNRCSPEKAFEFLKEASNARNIKLREVAKSVVASIAGTAEVQTRFID